MFVMRRRMICHIKQIKIVIKNALHKIYKDCQNIYDKKFRYFKRKHKKKGLYRFGNSSKDNLSEMWAKLKRISNPPTTHAALQIVRDDGSISNDTKEVLKR